jgi:chemotaxis protein histidine kinase CheA
MSDGMEQFQQLLREMRNGFLAEMPERCDQIEEGLLALEASPGDRETFNELYRNVHSLKGSGGTHGLVVISHICHQLENILAQFSDSALADEATSHALAHVDLLRGVAERAHNEDEDFSNIYAELSEYQPKTQKANRTILIAESSAMMAKLCQKALAGHQAHVTLVQDGLTALEHLTRDHYDLLVLGKELAQLNGIAVVAALRLANHRNSQLPVVLLTSNLTDIPSHVRIDQVVARDKQLASTLTSLSAALLK